MLSGRHISYRRRMKHSDLERLRTPNLRWRPEIRCASCGLAPSCPQLDDDVWKQVWVGFAGMVALGAMPRREPVCTNPLRCAQLNGQRHVKTCEITRGEPKALLCIDCAERVLARPLTLKDLSPCLANVQIVTFAQRAAKDYFTAGVQFEASGDVAGYGDLAESGGYDRAVDAGFERLWRHELGGEQ